MNRNPGKILSASRRTDIPAFYMDWFMGHIDSGFFTVKNPYTGISKRINVSQDIIHSIVFWSKNYDAFISGRAGKKLKQLGFNLYFNFTINSENAVLEPNLPPLKKRLEQLEELVSAFGPETIAWRFDPVCFFESNNKSCGRNNLMDFPVIAETAASLGIKKCVTSFFDDYAKIQKRLKFLSRKDDRVMRFKHPSLNKKKEVILRMEKFLAKAGMTLYLCCEKEVFSNLDAETSVLENSCIDGPYLKDLFGGLPETKRDYGQRSKKGCKCTQSIDIGSYDQHPCFHNCLFCYANPIMDTRIKKGRINEA